MEQSTNLTTWANSGQLTADATDSMTYHYTIESAEKRFYRFRKQ